MLAFIDHRSTTATPFKGVYDAKSKAALSTFIELLHCTTQ
jgi:hypothetical protein